MIESTWEGMHSGTAQDDKSYAKGMEKGRYLEGGYLIRLLNEELTQVKKTPFDGTNSAEVVRTMEGLEKAIRLLEDRCEEIWRRNDWK